LFIYIFCDCYVLFFPEGKEIERLNRERGRREKQIGERGRKGKERHKGQ
jgi:hypothetical protein